MINFVSTIFFLISSLSILSGFLFLSESDNNNKGSENSLMNTMVAKTKLWWVTSNNSHISKTSSQKYGIALSRFGVTSFLIALILRISALNMI